MVNRFDNSNLIQIRHDLNAAIAAVMQKHNIDLGIGKITYTAASFGVKLTGRTKNAEVANAALSFSLSRLGLPTNAIGRTIVYKGIGYEIIGINTRKKRYPVTTKVIATGKLMNFGSGLAASLLNQSPVNGIGG